VLTDIEKILQVLTNASFVEHKNQQLIRRDSSDFESDWKTLLQGEQEENQDTNDEWKNLDVEDKKIINKRKKRAEKIEELNVDMDEFFRNKKRFKPDHHEPHKHHTSFFKTRLSILKRILGNFLAELQTYTHTSIQIVTFLKTLVKNVHYNHYTYEGEEAEMFEEKYLLEWILENEPQTLLEVSQFWITNAYTLSHDNIHHSIQDGG